MNGYSSIIEGLEEAIEYEKGGLKGVRKHFVMVRSLTDDGVLSGMHWRMSKAEGKKRRQLHYKDRY